MINRILRTCRGKVYAAGQAAADFTCLCRTGCYLVGMETDTFFYQLEKKLPGTVFELVGLPAELARAYRFDSVELKKSLRLDGLFLPKTADLPLYFVEVQFRELASFYANLFAKVYCYLQENDPTHD